ncbi:hypothetical protein ACQ4XT_14225 [Halobacillus faecis]
MNPFYRIFGGLLLVLIDIHLGQIEILADFIGYLMVLTALNGMDGNLKGMKGARTTALVISILAIPLAFIGQPTGTTMGVSISIDLVTIYHQFTSIVHLILAYFLFYVFMDWSKKGGKEELRKRTYKLFRFYLGAHILYFSLIPFSINIPENVTIPLFIIGLGALLIMEIAFLVLIRTYHKEHQNIVPV